MSAFGGACDEAMQEAYDSFGKKSKASTKQRQAKAENALRQMLGIGMKFRDVSAPQVIESSIPERPQGWIDG